MPGGSDRRPPSLEEETAWMASAALAARVYGVRPALVIDCRGKASRACGGVLSARRAAIYLASTGANLSGRALARATGMRGPTLRHHLHAIEDAREVKASLDLLMDELTARLKSAGLTMAGVAA